jgi:hypothetical protein
MDSDIFDRYQELVDADKWDEVLPLIEQILEADSSVPTSWRNYGVCLDELGRHFEAARAFQNVLSLDFSDTGTRFRMLRSLKLADQMGVVYDEARVMLDHDPSFLVELSETDEFRQLFSEDHQFADLGKAAVRRVARSGPAEKISVGSTGGIEDRHIKQLEGLGFKVPEAVPGRWRSKPSLRPVEQIAQRVRALQDVFYFLAEVGDDIPTEEIFASLDSHGIRSQLVADEAYVVRVPRQQAMEQLGYTAGWYAERMLPLAWVLGFDFFPYPDGQPIQGESGDALTDFIGPPTSESIADWLASFEVRNKETVKRAEDLLYGAHCAVQDAEENLDKLPAGFDPLFNGGVIAERWQSLFWVLSPELSADPGLW